MTSTDCAPTVYLASDHAGYDLKGFIAGKLEQVGIELTDLGPHDANSVDYPDYAHAMAQALADSAEAVGILICGTGLGISMAANRHKNIRAAVCTNAFMAEMARKHNDANVLCLGSRVLGQGLALNIVHAFLETGFEGGRHANRIAKINP